MLELRDICFACDECPICEGLEYRLSIAEEGGYDTQIEYCGCDKVEDEFFISGFCEDAFIKKTPKEKRGKRKTGSAYRRAMAVKKKEDRLKILRKFNPRGGGFADWDHENGIWQLTGKYIKYSKDSHRQRYWKRYSNKAIRRGAEIGSGKGGQSGRYLPRCG